MIYLTSDTHFSHDKDFVYKFRGFDSPTEMNKYIVKKWNEIVNPDDIVYHLGDIVMSDIETGMETFKQLNGQFHIIRGNHDTDTKIEKYRELPNVLSIEYATEIQYRKFRFFLCHYPAITRVLDDKPRKQGIINLHGHTHQETNFRDDNNPYVYHVGMDSHNLLPVSLDDIIEEITKKKEELDDKKEEGNS